jgi:hypothetical protein
MLHAIFTSLGKKYTVSAGLVAVGNLQNTIVFNALQQCKRLASGVHC